MMVITGMAPTSGLPNTVVTISGSNFGTSATGLTVRFNGVAATIQSVTPTTIKVLVPVTTTGNVVLFSGNNTVTGPVFTYLFPELNGPYVAGDVLLHNQAEIDAFVALNKGRQLQLTGSLTIGVAYPVNDVPNDITSLDGLSLITSVTGQVALNRINLAGAPFVESISAAGSIAVNACAFTSLHFKNIRSLTGNLILSSLGKLTRITIGLSPSIGMISISQCPLQDDLSFLHPVVSATSVSLNGLSVTSLALDQLVTVRATVTIGNNPQLTSLRLPALTTVGELGIATPGAGTLAINYCPLLTAIDCRALTTLRAKLILRGLNISNAQGFGALTSAGALLVEANPVLTDLRGLEQLKSLTMTGVVANAMGSGSNPVSRVNGVCILNNAQLASLNGLQHISTIPVAYIVGNPMLNDLCPFKTSMKALSQLPMYRKTMLWVLFTYQPVLEL